MDEPDKVLKVGDAVRLAVGGGGMAVPYLGLEQIAEMITKFGGALIVLFTLAGMGYRAYKALTK